MRLVTYREGAGLATGLQGDDEEVYPLSQLFGDATLVPSVSPTLLQLIERWDVYGPHVLDAGQRVVAGEVQPGPPVSVVAPFPAPRRGAFAVAGNYRKHVDAAAQSTGVEQIKQRKGATFFIKPTGSFIGPQDDIEYDPDYTQAVDYEVELAIVVGAGGRDIPAERAMDHVFGFAVANDVSARDQMLRNKPLIDYFRGKGPDTFFPLGPGVTPVAWAPDHRDADIKLWVNGELRQSDSTSEMVRGVEELIAELSRSVTLLPGDVIATGTPAGVAVEMDEPKWLQDGDLVEAEVVGLGRLRNHVRVRRSTSSSDADRT